MWWVDRFGSISGPYTGEQIRKGIGRLQFTRYHRISADRKTWQRIDSTQFWNLQAGMPRPGKTPDSSFAGFGKSGMNPDAGDGGCGKSRRGRPPTSPLSGIGFRLRTIRLPRRVVLPLVLGTAFVAAVAVRFPAATAHKPDSESGGGDVEFAHVKKRVVLVESEDGSGTAFLVKMDGRKYVLTNDHVVRSAKPPKMTLVDGTELELGKMSVAKDRDLARFEIDCEGEYFELGDGLPDVGDKIWVYGNSQGDKVITRLAGEVSGVGPGDVKITAEIVGGNSGSPIVGEDGKVVAVASYLRNGANGKDWSTKGTEFDLPRRFGICPQKTEWVEVDRQAYMRGAAVLRLVDKYLRCLYPFIWCHAMTKEDLKGRTTEYDEFDTKAFAGEKGEACAEMLIDLSKAYAAMAKDGRRDSRRRFYGKCKEALIIARHVLDGEEWASPLMEHGYRKEDSAGSADWYRSGIDAWTEVNSKRLRKLR